MFRKLTTGALKGNDLSAIGPTDCRLLFSGSLLRFFPRIVIAWPAHDLINVPGSPGVKIRNALFHCLDLFGRQRLVITGSLSQPVDRIIAGLMRMWFRIVL
ncbi:MAG: hypothetical protein WAW33_02200 [Minisyncoccia bacterium]